MATLNRLSAAKRIVIKIGSALLVDRLEHKLKSDWLTSLTEDIGRLRQKGVDVVVVSSGSIALGREILSMPNGKLSLEQSQAAAAVGQIALARAYQEMLLPLGIHAAQVLLTSEDSEDRRRYLNTQATLNQLLSLGVVPIVNENDTVATDEIRFGDNDRLAAQVAVMAGADLLILLSDVDGLYTANPRINKDAEHIEIIENITPEIEAMAMGKGSETSNGGMKTKLLAAKTSILGGVAMVITIGEKLNPISALENGGRASWFLPKTSPVAARKNWISSMKPRGQIVIDGGALRALKTGSSLLAAGCVQAEGEFERGDAVDVCDENWNVIARGIVAYDFDEAKLVLRAKSSQIEDLLGYTGRGAMIHRDNLILL